jgi:hypothetical protein
MSTSGRQNKTRAASDEDAAKPRRKVTAEREKAKSKKPEAVPATGATTENNPGPGNQPAEHTTSDISTMEVHHHPQLEHKRRPVKEYLLESFMIFIAVMMGFIAENIRQDIDNNQQVKQLTSQLIQDLKADTVELNTIHNGDVQLLKANDSLYFFLQQPLAKADTKKIQQLVLDSHSIWFFHPSGGAIAAIKNQLHLKGFSNSKIIGHIARYEGHIELMRTLLDISLVYQRNFLDPFLRFHFTPANLQAAFKFRVIPNGQMRNLTQNDLTQLAADMALIRVNTDELVRDNLRLKTDAVNLLRYVQQQYHPDED